MSPNPLRLALALSAGLFLFSGEALRAAQSVVFDDFETGALKDPYTWADTAQGASVATWDVTSTQPASGALAGYFTYDSGSGPSFGAGAGESSPYTSGAPFDTVNPTSITIWLKGTDTLPLQVGVMEGNDNGADGELWTYNLTLPDANNWHSYTLPIALFTRSAFVGNQGGNNSFDLQSIQGVQVQVVGAQGIRSGVVWVDDISVSCDGFVPTPTATPTETETPTVTPTQTQIPVLAPFDDFESGTLQGPYSWADSANGAVVSSWAPSNAEAQAGSGSGAFSYDSGTGPSFGAGVGLSSPMTSGSPFDTNNASAITVWLKGQAGLQVQVQVMEGGDNGADGELWTTASFPLSDGNWNAYTFSPAQFSRSASVGNQGGNNAFDLQSALAVQVQVQGNQGAGVLYIDEISISCDSQQPTPTPTPSATPLPVGTPGVFEDFEYSLVNPYSFDDGDGSNLNYGLDGETQAHGGTQSLNIGVSTNGGLWGAGVGFQSTYGQPFNAAGQDRVRFWMRTDRPVTFHVLLKEANAAGTDPSNEAWVSDPISLNASPSYQMVELPFSSLGEDLNNPDCDGDCPGSGNNSFDSGVISVFELGFEVNPGTKSANVNIDDIAFDNVAAPTPTPAPTNAATPISVNSFATGDTSSSTLVLGTCVNDAEEGIAGDLYSFTLAQAGDVTITLCGGASFDTVLALYGDSAGVNMIDCDDDSQCGVQSELNVTLAAGTYWFYVTPYSGEGGGGSYTVALSASGGPTIPIDVAVEEPGRVFSSGGDAPWFGQTTISNFGGTAAQSGAIVSGQTSWMESVYKGPARLEFDWKLSGSFGDELDVLIDGAYQDSINGTHNWSHEQVSIPAGTHTVRWFYNKQFIGNTAWVDHIVHSSLGSATLSPTVTPTPTPTAVPNCAPYAGPQHLYAASAYPMGLPDRAVYLAGNVYVTDYSGSQVHAFDLNGNHLFSFGSFGSNNGEFAYATGIATDGTKLYIASYSNNNFEIYDSAGSLLDNFYVPAGTTDVAVNGSDIYVTNANLNIILRYNMSGTQLANQPAVSGSPVGVVVSGGYVDVMTGAGTIERFDASLNPITTFNRNGTGCGQLESPQSIVSDGAGGFYVANTGMNSIERFDSGWNSHGSFYGDPSTGTLFPYGLAMGPGGQLIVANMSPAKVLFLDSAVPTATDTPSITPTPTETATATITPTYAATPINVGDTASGDLSTATTWLTSACDPSGDGPFPGNLYAFTVATTSAIDISLCGGNDHDSTLALFDSMSGSNVLACNDDACGSRSEIIKTLTPGTYYFYVSAYNADELLDYQVSVTDVSAPSGLDTALDIPGQAFTTGGDTPWSVDPAINFYGGSSARSGLLEDGQQSWIESSFTGPVSVNFYWQISGFGGGDWAEVEVDGVPQKTINNVQSWAPASVSLAAGPHTVRWTYYRTTAPGRLWLDQVSVQAITPLDVAVELPGQAFRSGGDAPWFGQQGTVNFGTSAAQSGPIVTGQDSWIEADFKGPATIDYDLMVHGNSQDILDVRDNGSPVDSFYGVASPSWSRHQVAIGAGTHTLRWDYHKDGQVIGFTAWLDHVVYSYLGTPTQTPSPTPTATPTPQLCMPFSGNQRFVQAIGSHGFNSDQMLAGHGITRLGSNLYVVDQPQQWVQVYDSSGVHQFSFGHQGQTGPGSGYFYNPTDIDTDGTYLYTTEYYNNIIQVFDAAGNHVGEFGNGSDVNGAFGLTVAGGRIYVASHLTDNVAVFATGTAGTLLGHWNMVNGADHPSDIVVNGGNVDVICDSGNVERFDLSGAWQQSFSLNGAGCGLLNGANGAVADGAGGAYVANGDGSIARYDGNWAWLGELYGDGNSGPLNAFSMVLGAGGELFVSDYNGRIAEFDSAVPTATPTLTPTPTVTITPTYTAISISLGDTDNGNLGSATAWISSACDPSGDGPFPGDIYTFTLASTTTVDISLCGGNDHDTTLALFDSLNGSNVLACNDDSCGGRSEIVQTLNAGTYYFYVSAYNADELQDYQVSLKDISSPAGLDVALDIPGQAVNTGGDLPWSIDNSIFLGGGSSLHSSQNLQVGQSDYVELSVTGPVQLNFHYQLSAGDDELDFNLDGSGLDYGYGVHSWTNAQISVPGGAHTVRWVYYKSSPSGRAWLDLLSAVVPTPTITPTPGCGVSLLGNNSAAQDTTTIGGNTVAFTPYLATGSGTVDTINFGGNIQLLNLKVGIYADNSGTPGVLLGASADYNPPATGFHDVPLLATVPVVQGQRYWLAIQSDVTLNPGVHNGGPIYTLAAPFASGLPADASGASFNQSYGMALLAIGCNFVATAVPTASPSPTLTQTPSATETPSASSSPTGTLSASATATETPSATPTATSTATETPSITVTASFSVTVTSSPTLTETPSATPTASFSASETLSSTQSPTATATPSASSTVSPSVTPTLCSVSLLAGIGGKGSSGDGGQAAAAGIDGPWGIDVDNSGATILSEYNSGNIRRIDKTGVISTLATLDRPAGLIVDGNGNAYVCETGSHSIVRVQPNGVTSTVAGTGTGGNAGLTSTAAAASLELNSAAGIALAPDGSVYIADTGNHAIRHVALNGQMSTVAGTGLPGYLSYSASATASPLSLPVALAVAANGDVYIADNNNQAIRKLSGGLLSTVLGSGSAGSSGDGPAGPGSDITDPRGIAIDGAGALFFTEGSSGRVRRFYQGQLSTVVSGTLSTPRELVVTHSGDILVTDDTLNQAFSLGACGIAVGHPNYPICLPGSLASSSSARFGAKDAPASGEASSYVVAPNPASSGGDLCAYFERAPLSSAWSVYNMAGEEVLRARFSGQAQQCVANNLAPGVYFINIESRGFNGTTKSELRKVAVVR